MDIINTKNNILTQQNRLDINPHLNQYNLLLFLFLNSNKLYHLSLMSNKYQIFQHRLLNLFKSLKYQATINNSLLDIQLDQSLNLNQYLLLLCLILANIIKLTKYHIKTHIKIHIKTHTKTTTKTTILINIKNHKEILNTNQYTNSKLILT